MDDMKILYAPGEEPQELKKLLGEFFKRLDSSWPDRTIIWAEWDHAALDKPAARLCTALGYFPHGAKFLTAYGYSILTDRGLIEADRAKEKPAGDEPHDSAPIPAVTETEPVRQPAPPQETPAHETAPVAHTMEQKTTEPSATESFSPEKTPAPQENPAATESAVPAPPDENVYRTGRVVRVLPNGNSGFVRDDETGMDHYFNVRRFTHWVDELRVGLAVRYRIEPHFERKHNTVRDNAVELTCLYHQGIPGERAEK